MTNQKELGTMIEVIVSSSWGVVWKHYDLKDGKYEWVNGGSNGMPPNYYVDLSGLTPEQAAEEIERVRDVMAVGKWRWPGTGDGSALLTVNEGDDLVYVDD